MTKQKGVLKPCLIFKDRPTQTIKRPAKGRKMIDHEKYFADTTKKIEDIKALLASKDCKLSELQRKKLRNTASANETRMFKRKEINKYGEIVTNGDEMNR